MVTTKKYALATVATVSLIGSSVIGNVYHTKLAATTPIVNDTEPTYSSLLEDAREALVQIEDQDPSPYRSERAKQHLKNAQEYEEKAQHERDRAQHHEIKHRLKQIYARVKSKAIEAKNRGQKELYDTLNKTYEEFKKGVYNFWRNRGFLPQ